MSRATSRSSSRSDAARSEPVAQRGEVRAHARERRAQLVAGVGREALGRGDGLLQAGEHRVERARDLVDLGRARSLDARGQVAGRAHARGAGRAAAASGRRARAVTSRTASAQREQAEQRGERDRALQVADPVLDDARAGGRRPAGRGGTRDDAAVLGGDGRRPARRDRQRRRAPVVVDDLARGGARARTRRPASRSSCAVCSRAAAGACRRVGGGAQLAVERRALAAADLGDQDARRRPRTRARRRASRAA